MLMTQGLDPRHRRRLAGGSLTRTVRSQLELLLAALAALEAIGGFIEELTGEAVPPEVRAGTAMVVAVAAFLLVWLDHESPRAAVEHSEGT